MSIKILIADDDPANRIFLQDTLDDHDYQFFEASTGNEVLTLLHSHESDFFDLLILDLVMPELDGMGILRHPSIQDKLTMPIIVQTSQGGLEKIEESLSSGAIDFLVKPICAKRLKLSVRHGLQLRETRRVVNRLTDYSKDIFTFDTLIGESASFLQAKKLGEQALNSSLPILIEGESGVGKRTFSKILIGANPNTLFIDEIGNLSSSQQLDLLTKLDSKNSNIRLIATTSDNLQSQILQGSFRQDLYTKLSVSPIRIPALRNRKDDIASLSRHFCTRFSLESHNKIRDISSASLDLLISHSWSGNIRELSNTIYRAVHLCSQHRPRHSSDTLHPCDFPTLSKAESNYSASSPVVAASISPHSLEKVEKQAIELALFHHVGRIAPTARELGIGRSTLYRKIREFNIVH